MARSAFYQLFLDWDSLATVVHTFVAPQLDHCHVLYVGLPFRLVKRL